MKSHKYKIKVHVKNEDVAIDSDVFVDIFLPHVPRKGDSLWLNMDLITELEKKARKNVSIAERYAPDFFYGKSLKCEEIDNENLKDLSF